MVYLSVYLINLFFILLGEVKHGNCGLLQKVGPQPIWNATHTDILRQDLLLNYDKFTRPAQHYDTLVVKFGLEIKHVELDEFESQLTVYAWVRMEWIDEKLKWNPDDYGGINVVRLADHEIWQPDIFLYNSATATGVGHYAKNHLLVYQDGDVRWLPPCQFTVLCDLNLKYWPFDEQTCNMKFGSWTYNGDLINLELYSNMSTVEVEEFIESTEWKITDTKVEKNTWTYACCPEPYMEISANITIQRRSPSYQALIVKPAFAILILMLTTFWLPPNSGEKIILNGCVAVIICMFLLYFTQKIPAMGTHTPLIVLFYSNCLNIVGSTIIISVIVIWLYNTKHTSPMPWVIKKPLTGTFGKWLGLTVYIQQSSFSHRGTAEKMRGHHVTDLDGQNSNDDHHIIRPSTKPSLQQDWMLLAVAIDRLSFCFYSLVALVMVVSYSL